MLGECRITSVMLPEAVAKRFCPVLSISTVSGTVHRSRRPPRSSAPPGRRPGTAPLGPRSLMASSWKPMPRGVWQRRSGPGPAPGRRRGSRPRPSAGWARRGLVGEHRIPVGQAPALVEGEVHAQGRLAWATGHALAQVGPQRGMSSSLILA
jgi:hypothetical protein